MTSALYATAPLEPTGSDPHAGQPVLRLGPELKDARLDAIHCLRSVRSTSNYEPIHSPSQ
jgi:hypothetical protein